MPKKKEYKVVRISLDSYKIIKALADKDGRTFISALSRLLDNKKK